MRKTVLENKYINIDPEDIESVSLALQGGQLAGTARIIPEYEQALADYFNCDHALAVSSGTAALHVLLYAYNIGPGDEVVLPPTAPIMSALPVLAVGAHPIFVDVEPDNFSYDLADLKKKVTPKTKAIVSVPMWGYPTRIDHVMEYAHSKGIPVIEDASHCHGAKDGDIFVGVRTDVGFFSTQERKMITTGEGGFILTNNQDISDKVKEVRDFGKPVRQTPALAGHMGQYGYLFGLNFRLNAMSAALGITQLKKLSAKIKQRTQNAQTLIAELFNVGWLKELKVPTGTTPNYYSMVLFVDHPTRTAHDVAKELYEENIVSDTYRFGIKPLYELPIFNAFASDCPNARQLLRLIITVPTHEGLSESDINDIVLHLKKISHPEVA